MADVLSAEQVTKSFPGVLAVDHVSLSLEYGEVLALVGENGAGKSTLMHVLGGSHRPEEGRILIEGEPVVFGSPEDAIQAGISVVPQELSLVGSLSVAENIFANRQPVRLLNLIDWRRLFAETQSFLSRFGLTISPKRLVKDLSVGQQQILEILKAISTNPKVLILDEPTSALTEAESAYLFDSIRKLQRQGMSFIYVTHKLFEVFEIASRVIVLRDGKFIGSKKVVEVTEDELVAMMVGRQISNLYGDREAAAPREVYFRVEGLERKRHFRGISFELRRGEILGMAGLVGAHRTDIGRAIFGADPVDGGRRWLNGEVLPVGQPATRIRQDRLPRRPQARRLVPGDAIEDNLRPRICPHAPGRPSQGEDEEVRREGRLGVCHRYALGREEGRQTLGREPAEGAGGDVDGDSPGGHHLRRAHAGCGRRREGRDLRQDPAVRRRRDRSRPDLIRHGRTDRHVRSDPGDP
jgi:ABC-type sugar transport system ATPase subunit